MKLTQSLFRYAHLTVFSFVLNVGSTIFLHEVAGVSEELAFAVALTLVFCTNFFIMRNYVYEGASGSLRRQFVIYALSAASFRSTEYLAFLLLHTWRGFDYRLVVIGVLSTSTLVKFFYYRFAFERLGQSQLPA